MKAWMSFSAAGGVREGLILAILRRWKKEVLTTWRMWGSRERVGSKITPRLRACGGGGNGGAINGECGVVEFAEGRFGADEEEFSFVAV